jgi:hypothetical protein
MAPRSELHFIHRENYEKGTPKTVFSTLVFRNEDAARAKRGRTGTSEILVGGESDALWQGMVMLGFEFLGLTRTKGNPLGIWVSGFWMRRA